MSAFRVGARVEPKGREVLPMLYAAAAVERAMKIFECATPVSTPGSPGRFASPEAVFGPALRLLGVASVILAHNHPSGDATPSREDLRLTRQLVDAGKLLEIRVHDHVILGDGESAGWVSLAERGEL